MVDVGCLGGVANDVEGGSQLPPWEPTQGGEGTESGRVGRRSDYSRKVVLLGEGSWRVILVEVDRAVH